MARLGDLNSHLACVLCDGYLVDATTIVECLHSFCKTCIVRHLENSKFCPVCDVQVHKTKPLEYIRSDQTLQDIVYKLVPGLYQNEMRRRRVVSAAHPEAAPCPVERRFIYSPDELVSLALHYRAGCGYRQGDPTDQDPQPRYLQCPAAVSVAHLKKFVSMKFGLPRAYSVEIIHHDDVLNDEYTLMDIAYIYSWKRAGPMQFFYNVMRRVVKRIRSINAAETSKPPSLPEEAISTDLASDLAEKASEPKSKLMKLLEETEADTVTPLENSKANLSETPPLVIETTCTNAAVPSPSEILRSVSSASTPVSTAVTVERSAKGRPRKKRTPRCKSSTRPPLVRLAPYPPPSAAPPVRCLAAAPLTHLAPIAVRGLVSPAGLAPLMTLRGPALCSSSVVPSNPQMVATHSSFRAYQPHTTTTNFISPIVSASTPVVPPLLTVNSAKTSTSALASDIPTGALAALSMPSMQSKIAMSAELARTPPFSQANQLVSCVISTASTTTSQPCEVPIICSLPTQVSVTSSMASLVTSTVTSTNSSVLSTVEKSDVCVVPPATAPSAARVFLTTVPNNSTKDLSDPCKGIVCDVATNDPVPTSIVAPADKTQPAVISLPKDDVAVSLPSEPQNDPKSVEIESPAVQSIDNRLTGEKRSESLNISAEFSDNEPELVVDEQKLDSSDNEDDALRRKIAAIAEKEDDADSGRASDRSSRARSDDDRGSPAAPLLSCTAQEDGPRPARSLALDHVISNLHRSHERKDDVGALDLSTCARRPDLEVPRSRHKAVANPAVLDAKHRQQTCLAAPKQHTACAPSPKHTACVPAPKHPTMRLSSAHHGLLSAACRAPRPPLAFPGLPSDFRGWSSGRWVPSPAVLCPSPHKSAATSSAPSPKLSQPTTPIYKKSTAKGHHRFNGRNLTVYNPDPNGFRQKIVIRNLDFRPNAHHPQRL